MEGGFRTGGNAGCCHGQAVLCVEHGAIGPHAQPPPGLDRGRDRIINSVQSIRNCYRKPLTHLLLEGGIHIPPSRIVSLEHADQAVSTLLSKRLWLKRGDVHAIQEGDVVSVETPDDLAGALDIIGATRWRDVLIQEHVEGPCQVLRVGRQAFFRAYLAETGEDITSHAEALADLAGDAARVLGLEVYGGDAVLTQQSGPILIDMNDWPSFSRCSRPAGRSIATYLTEETRHSGDWSFTHNLQALSRA